jgi:hypothetical protein
MIEHPSLLSMPLPSKDRDKLKVAIDDQDAHFVFKLISCRNREFSEFYLINVGVRTQRIQL